MKDESVLRQKQDDILKERSGGWDNPVLTAKDETLGFLLGDMDSPVEAITDPPTTDGEIDKLIEAVKAEYESLPEYSLFGDPNWKVRDATVEILKWAKED